MIGLVDEALRTLVRRDVVDGANVDVAFDAPTSDWSAKRQGPALNLYLYDIREDVQRRQSQFAEVFDDGVVVARVKTPRFFKLSYLVTAWTQRPEDEHRLLSAVLGAFLSSEALPRDVLGGQLAELGWPLIATVAKPPPQDRSLADVWSALGGDLKPSVDLVISTPFLPKRDEDVRTGPPVTEPLRLALLDGDAGARPDAATAGGRSATVAGSRAGAAARGPQGSRHRGAARGASTEAVATEAAGTVEVAGTVGGGAPDGRARPVQAVETITGGRPGARGRPDPAAKATGGRKRRSDGGAGDEPAPEPGRSLIIRTMDHRDAP